MRIIREYSNPYLEPYLDEIKFYLDLELPVRSIMRIINAKIGLYIEDYMYYTFLKKKGVKYKSKNSGRKKVISLEA